MRPCQKIVETIIANRQDNRQSDGRPDRITPAHPVPEREHVFGVDAESPDCFGIGRNSNEMPRQIRLGRPLQKPLACRMGIQHRLHRRKSLGGHDEQSGIRGDAFKCCVQIVSVHVGNEMHFHLRQGKLPQSLTNHLRPQIGAAYADIDDVGYPLACVTHPITRMNPGGENPDSFEHLMNIPDNILTINRQV